MRHGFQRVWISGGPTGAGQSVEAARKARRRRLFVTTSTLDSAIAAPASIGFSSPSAATGIASTL